jgi:hypothetical protein
MPMFFPAEERDEFTEPAVSAVGDAGPRHAIGKSLKPRGIRAGQEGVLFLSEGNAEASHALGQPLVTVHADTGIEGKVRADTQEHPAKVSILQVEVVLPDTAGIELDSVSAGFAFIADGDPGVLAAFEDDGDARRGTNPVEEGLDKIFATDFFGGHDDIDLLVPSHVFDPAMVVLGDLTEVLSI